MIIEGKDLYYSDLNRLIKASKECQLTVENVNGQRYIGTGVSGKNIVIHGTAGNGTGAYLNECNLTIFGNVQDAVGDAMNNGEIVIHGSAGDTLGYAMRGGQIYVKGDGGYRLGIHMKEYKSLKPVIVVGGKAGSFLGEYQAGGIIIVLGLKVDNEFPAGPYCGTGMHGGVMYIRSDVKPDHLPAQVLCEKCELEDLAVITPLLQKYANYFDVTMAELIKKPFYRLTPNGNNPYTAIYAHN